MDRRPPILLIMVWSAAAAAAASGCGPESVAPARPGPPIAELASGLSAAPPVSLQAALQPLLCHNAEINAYFDRLGERLLKGAEEAQRAAGHPLASPDVHVSLLLSDERKAFALRGGHIYVCNGLFQVCGDEEAVAAAVAHQLAHVLDGHLRARNLGESGTPGQLETQIALAPFTAAQEAAADRDGLRFYAFAHWDPQLFGELFEATSGRTRSPRADRADEFARPLGQHALNPPIVDRPKFIALQGKAAAQPRAQGPQSAEANRLVKSFWGCTEAFLSGPG